MNYSKIYADFIADRRAREAQLLTSGVYVERHHVVPRSLNGGDEAENIIALTAEDHIHAHILLGQIYGGEMWAAVYWFFGRNNRVPSKLERKAKAIARVKYQEYLSSAERREIITSAVKASWDDEKTRANRVTGLKKQWQTEDRKAKQTAALKGKKRDPEIGRKVGLAQKGKIVSEETKAKLREAWKTRRLVGVSQETRDKISASMTGRVRSDKHRAALSASMKGKKRPDLTGARHGRAKAIRCLCTGEVFSSQADAVRAGRIAPAQRGSFKSAVESGKTINGYHWEYVS